MKNKLLISLTIVTLLLVSASITLNKGETKITGYAVNFGQGCCELTCTETDSADCPANLFSLGESCFNLEECNLGCCIDGEGYCYTNYLRSSCEREDNVFVRGRECSEYKECLVAPPFPADQTGYMFTNKDGVLGSVMNPYAGNVGTKFEIAVTTLSKEASVKVNISSTTYQVVLELADDGILPDLFVNDEEYRVEWDSRDHPSVWQITPVKIQPILDGKEKGLEELLFLTPNDCAPSMPTWDLTANRTNILFARKSNLDYLDTQQRGIGLWHQLLNDLYEVQENYELYHLENTRENTINIASDCAIGLGENDLIILFDFDEPFCRQEGKMVVASNAIIPKAGMTITNANFTKNFCDYVHSPIQDLEDFITSFQNPIIEILDPLENVSTNEPTLDLSFRVTDNQSGMLRYSVYLGSDNNQLAWGYMVANTTVTRTVNLQDGLHKLYVMVQDLDMNVIGEQRILNVSVNNFTLQSNLEPEMISLKTFTMELNVTHDTQENITALIFDGWNPVMIGNLTVNETKIATFNLTPGEHEIWAAAYDKNGRKATTPVSDVTVFGVPDDATSPSQRLSLQIAAIDSIGGINYTSETINYQMFITENPQTITLDKCGLDEDTGEGDTNPAETIDEYCLNEIRINQNTIELDFYYSHGGESYIQAIQVNGTLEGTNFSEEKIIATIKPDGEEVGDVTITTGSSGLTALTGAFLWFDDEEERFSPTVAAPSWVDDENVAGYTGGPEPDEEGCIEGPDGKRHWTIDDAGFYEPMLLCSEGQDQGIMFRPIQCIDSFTTDIQIDNGLKTKEETGYKYQLNYEVFSCNEDIFVDIRLKNCVIEGVPGTQEEELFSTTLDVAYKVTSTEEYESQLNCAEFCIFVSDETVADVPRCIPFEIPQCSDGIDNENPGDGLTDMDDPGCSEPNDNDEGDGTSECQDTDDNDRDGLVDEDDPGCHEEGKLSKPYKPTHNNEAGATTQCQDGADNDGDKVCDYAGCTIGGTLMPPDPGCSSPSDDRENDGTTECQDGIDNDFDGRCDNGCTIAGFTLPPDHGCFLDLSCYPSCYDQTIDDENRQVPVCYLLDDNTIELNANIYGTGSEFRYVLDYTIHACRARMVYNVYLTTLDGSSTYNVIGDAGGTLIKDQSEIITDYEITLPDQYDKLCVWTAGEGTQCTGIQAGM